MIGDFLNTNKRREVKTRADQIIWHGKKYQMEKDTGYYVCTSGNRQRLHVAMWEDKWGRAVPEGCIIHHMDWVKSHNYIDNLICLSISEHNSVHNPKGREAKSDDPEVIKLTQELIASRVNGVPAGY